MTNKQLAKLGLHHVRNRMYSVELNSGHVEIHVMQHYTITDVLSAIYDRGFLEGSEVGEEKKVKAFRHLLNIKDDE